MLNFEIGEDVFTIQIGDGKVYFNDGTKVGVRNQLGDKRYYTPDGKFDELDYFPSLFKGTKAAWIKTAC